MLNPTSKKQTTKSWKSFENESEQIRISDSLNVLLVTKILDRYGWLGKNDIGFFGVQTIFLVLQHGNLATHEKYLPMIRVAFQDKKLSTLSLALYEDRISLKKNRFQLYGTQLFYVKDLGRYVFFPIQNPEGVVQMRKNIGIDSFVYDDYLKTFNLNWQLEKYFSDSSLLANKNIRYY
jgi:hypothetical protein